MEDEVIKDEKTILEKLKEHNRKCIRHIMKIKEYAYPRIHPESKGIATIPILHKLNSRYDLKFITPHCINCNTVMVETKSDKFHCGTYTCLKCGKKISISN